MELGDLLSGNWQQFEQSLIYSGIPIGVARLTIMLIPILFGLFLGWMLSPFSRFFRTVVFIAGIALLAFVALSNSNPFFGWSAAFTVAIVGFFWAIGHYIRKWFKLMGETPTTFGSSRWADSYDLEDHGVYGDEGIRLGHFNKKRKQVPISYKGDRHLLTVAPTRSGKGTTQIIPNLLTYEGAMLVIDPKGENALITAQRRKDMGQDVHIVDPWGIVDIEGIETSKFNPLDWLKKDDLDITENAMILADALVVEESHGDSFWTEESKALLQGIILYVATDEREDGNRHLSRVRELLLMDGEQQKLFFRHMLQSQHYIVASTGARCLQKEPKLIANVIASAQAQTHFLDSARLQLNLASSDFKFEDLKTKPMTVYLVLPADRLNSFGRWLRLLIQQAITVNARNIEIKPAKPVLFILDEFAALGRLTMIEQAYGLMAGFGLQLWGIVQDFNQLERIYDKGWQSFVSNAGVINYFGSSDTMTSEYFSSMCGETTVWNFSSAVSSAFTKASETSSTSMTNSDTRAASQRKLIYPDELMRMNKSLQLVFIENMPPLIANKTPWFHNDVLKTLGVNLEIDETPMNLKQGDEK